MLKLDLGNNVAATKGTFILTDGNYDEFTFTKKQFKYNETNEESKVAKVYYSKVVGTVYTDVLNHSVNFANTALNRTSVAFVDKIELPVDRYKDQTDKFIVIAGKNTFAMLNTYSMKYMDEHDFLNKHLSNRDKYYKKARKAVDYSPLEFRQVDQMTVMYKQLLIMYREFMLGKIKLENDDDYYYLLKCLFDGGQNIENIKSARKTNELIKKYSN